MKKNTSKIDMFSFIDLFAGIGGIRSGFEAHGGHCVFTSEWNVQSQKTYRANFQDEHEIAGDITEVDARDIPDHDVLLAGFPCQPFSIAGVSKKNALGRPHGFMCATQGTLFFDVARIISAKRPKAFLLENVKNLMSHDKGNTFRVIRSVLEDELGYRVFTRIIDARHFVPQHRERIFIVGFREDTSFCWDDLALPGAQPLIGNILHPGNGSEAAEEPYTSGRLAKVNEKYILTDNLWEYLQKYAEKHRAKGNGFGFGLVGPGDVARTLSARYYKDGSEILVSRGKGRNPRRLTPRECARLMGYPDTFKIPVSDTQAYMQFGNSVAVPVVRAVAKIMVPHVLKIRDQKKTASAKTKPSTVFVSSYAPVGKCVNG
ncbi:DNA (cytosine-5-)-methyltransferase [Geobacter anodireducens]